MKKNILLILIFCFSNFLLPAQDSLVNDHPVRVISYNIRFDYTADAENSWIHRKSKVVSLLRFHGAEIFCLQEALINQVRDIEEAFPGFEYYGPGRNDGKESGEACPIFYRKDLFEIEDSGTFWYSETPKKPGSIDWEANLPRIASWIKLIDLFTNLEFVVVSTHFDHESQLSRNNSARLLKSKLNQISDNIPVIICGDFNDRPATESYWQMLSPYKGLELYDARSLTEQNHHGPDFTFIGFDFEGVSGDIIDYIFVNDLFRVIKHGYLTDNWNGIFPSDHLPVFVELNFN